jgi:beta-glucosidase
LTYRSGRNLGQLPEAAAAVSNSANVSRFIESGRPLPPWSIAMTSAGATADAAAGATANRALVLALDGSDAFSAAWSGAAPATLSVRGAQIDLTRQTNGDMALSLDVRVDTAPAAPVSLAVGCGAACRGAVDITGLLRDAAGDGWSRLQIRLSCFRAAGADLAVVEAPMEIATSGAQTLAIRNLRLVPGEGTPTCPGGQ